MRTLDSFLSLPFGKFLFAFNNKSEYFNVITIAMKRLILFSILVCFGISSAWSSHKNILELCQAMDYTNLQTGLKKLERDPPQPNVRYSLKTLLNNELCSDFWQESRSVEVLISDSLNPLDFKLVIYQLNLIRHNNVIIYFKINELQEQSKKVINFWYDKNLDSMNSLLARFVELNGYNLVKEDLFQYGEVYGLRCGIHGTLPSLRKRFLEIMENQDMNQLNAWLRSVVIEKQVYAFEGLIELQQEGIGLDADTLQLMLLLKNKKGQIMYCDGNKKKLVGIDHAIKPILDRFDTD
jgi:hypothetical protein